ncbi:MAG: DNA-directed RNA polymerase subunit omega [Thermodesulfovibrionales bacterium]|nr:DNA-directed RNA polymerase subunit omega [Thermodesulfovibrionales bacterium]
MDIVSLPIEFDKKKMDSRFRLVNIAGQRAKELAMGVKPKIKAKGKKATTIAIEETLDGVLEFLVGEEARAAGEEARKFDYRKLLEEKKREAVTEDLSELEKDLKVYLTEKKEVDRRAIDEFFAEKQEKGGEEPEG